MAPRCQPGTRRNKKTGNCEKKVSSTKKRCPNGTRRNKTTGNCESSKSSKLTASDIKSILSDSGVHAAEDKRMITAKLKQMTYDPNYESCWDGKPQRDLYTQALAKVQCWGKYGDSF
jgi:hypothetical protein